MPGKLTERHVVTCFLESEGKILLLRRSQRVGTYRGRWAGVSGYVETTPDEQALTEIREETSLGPEDVDLVSRGDVLQVEDGELGVRWVVHPYLFHVSFPERIAIDWEHVETRWVFPGEIAGYETVPGLKETLERVYPAG